MAFALAECAMSPAPLIAAITVTTTPASGPTFTLTPVGSKTRVTLNTAVNTQPTTFLVRGGPTDQIEQVNINASVSFQTTFVEIRGLSLGTAIASIDSINIGTSTSTVVLLDARTSGDVGTIRVNAIAGMNVGGNLTGSITLAPRGNGSESSFIEGTIVGRLLGNLTADQGGLYELDALGGIGAPGAPVQIRTRDAIHRLSAGEIYADINTFANGGAGHVGTIQTTTGPFAGSLATRQIASTGAGEPGVLSVFGDLDANVTITQNIANDNGGSPVVNVGGVFAPTRVFRVGGSLSAGAPIRIATPGGLRGQVIINGDNAGGAWLGAISVGPTGLNPAPAYTPTSSALGGGAAGQAPFMLHTTDCFPPSGAVLPASAAPTPANPIRLRYYGPITWTVGTTPLVIEAAPIGSPGAWTDQTSCFSIAREPGLTPHPNVIAAYPLRGLATGYVYRIRPVLSGSAALQCDLGLAVPVSVAAPGADYLFTLAGGCAGDADGNALVNFADIVAVLAAWSAPTTCRSAADVNADGVISFVDITTVLAMFGRTCP